MLLFVLNTLLFSRDKTKMRHIVSDVFNGVRTRRVIVLLVRMPQQRFPQLSNHRRRRSRGNTCKTGRKVAVDVNDWDQYLLTGVACSPQIRPAIKIYTF